MALRVFLVTSRSPLNGAVLSQRELRNEVEKSDIRFDPPLEEKQWAEASVNLRLGLKFAKWKEGRRAAFRCRKESRPHRNESLARRDFPADRRVRQTQNLH